MQAAASAILFPFLISAYNRFKIAENCFLNAYQRFHIIAFKALFLFFMEKRQISAFYRLQAILALLKAISKRKHRFKSAYFI